MSNIAIITHDFSGFSGSEIVAMEIANYFSDKGHDVTIRAERWSNKLNPWLRPKVVISSQRINICDYDIVWSQMGLFSINTGNLEDLINWNGVFIGAHLSSFVPAELYHYPFSAKCAGIVAVCAESVKSRLEEHSSPKGIIFNFRNSAPREYLNHPTSSNKSINKLLVVSNHISQEVTDAIELLKIEGITVVQLGSNNEYRLIRPDDIKNCDAVISIGKTAQYAFLGGKPLYCYDHFGGPGWITEDTFIAAEEQNFSGRCSKKKKTPHEIKDEIVNGFSKAKDFIAKNHHQLSINYSLESNMDHLMDIISKDNVSNYINDKSDLEMIDLMRGSIHHFPWIWSDLLPDGTGSFKELKNKLNNIKDANAEILSQNASLKDELKTLKNEVDEIKSVFSINWPIGFIRQPHKISYWNRIRIMQRRLMRK